MAPFMESARVVDVYGEVPLTRFTNVCIMSLMGCVGVGGAARRGAERRAWQPHLFARRGSGAPNHALSLLSYTRPAPSPAPPSSPPLPSPSLPFPPRSCCLVNLCAGPLLSLYIQAVDRAQRHAELRNFPVFGVPLLLLLASACLGLLCVPPPPPPLLLRGTPLSA